MTRPAQRTEAELMRLRLEAVEAWHQARWSAEEVAAPPAASREAQRDVARQRQVRREQHRAMLARAQQQLDRGARLLSHVPSSSAVVVHRNAWFVGKLTRDLADRGIEVVAALQDGAEGVGVVVAEQPDVLVVEDSLPTVPGEEVVREARRFSPSTLVVAQVAYDDRVTPLLEAGAHAAYTRRVPPAEVVRGLADLLGQVLDDET